LFGETTKRKKEMDRQKLRTFARLILILAATLVWAIYPGFGQNNGKGNGKGNVCKPNQQHCTTQDARWQAAINNANRRADDIRKNPGKAKGHTK
jgi:hypothetical protein